MVAAVTVMLISPIPICTVQRRQENMTMTTLVITVEVAVVMAMVALEVAEAMEYSVCPREVPPVKSFAIHFKIN